MEPIYYTVEIKTAVGAWLVVYQGTFRPHAFKAYGRAIAAHLDSRFWAEATKPDGYEEVAYSPNYWYSTGRRTS